MSLNVRRAVSRKIGSISARKHIGSLGQGFKIRRDNKMSKYEIMQRVADTRKEIETFAQDWADVPGGTRNPLAVADWERLWRQLDELFAELRGCAVA